MTTEENGQINANFKALRDGLQDVVKHLRKIQTRLDSLEAHVECEEEDIEVSPPQPEPTFVKAAAVGGEYHINYYRENDQKVPVLITHHLIADSQAAALLQWITKVTNIRNITVHGPMPENRRALSGVAPDAEQPAREARITVHVTQKHIDKGVRKSCDYSPINKAIAQATKSDVEYGTFVGVSHMWWWGEDEKQRRQMKIPPKVKEFLDRFDNGLPVEPFTFELKAK